MRGTSKIVEKRDKKNPSVFRVQEPSKEITERNLYLNGERSLEFWVGVKEQGNETGRKFRSTRYFQQNRKLQV